MLLIFLFPCKFSSIHDGDKNFLRTLCSSLGIVTAVEIVSEKKLQYAEYKEHNNASICPVLGLYSISGYSAGCQIQLVSTDIGFHLCTGIKLGSLTVTV